MDTATENTSLPRFRLASIDSVFPDPHNPRKHSKSQIKRIARSIETFGFIAPLLIDGHGVIIAGHGRYEAARLLQRPHVPVVSVEHLSPEQVRAYRIADNQLTDQSSWDDALLAQNLKILCDAQLSFDITDIGMDMGEIDLRIASIDLNSVAQAAAKDDPADVFSVRTGLPVTALGDLWLLAEHRLVCADSTKPTSYEQLMNGRLCRVVFTDPPYNVPICGHVSVNRSGKGVQHREFAMAVGEMSELEFTQFLRSVFEQLARCSMPGALHYLCMDFRHMREILDAGMSVYSELKNLCVWSKNTAGMGSMYRSRHELVFVFKHGKASHINNVELGRHGRYRSNVWEYKSINSTRRSDEEGDLLALHPTVKPVRLVQDAILDSSKRGEIVLDAFLGSGSTLIAAHRAGRICHGLELDPLYVDTAIERWQADTGMDAVLAATGETYTQRKQRILGQTPSNLDSQAGKETGHV